MPFTPHMHQYQHVPKQPTALYYITYLSLANPSNIGPKPCNAYKLHWEKVNFPLRIDGHRRVIDQCLSHYIYTSTSTYQNTNPFHITLPSYLNPSRQTSAPNHAMHINCIGKK